MIIQLLVDSTEFWPALQADLASAREQVLIQALTFEGDTVGKGLVQALLGSPAGDRRMLVDSFSRYVISDKLWAHPKHLFDRALRREVSDSRAAVRELERAGVGFRFVNPVGALGHRFPVRNHKKLVAVDRRLAYVGGINFSEHNFAWHDLMLRIEDPELAAFLADDFLWTWGGCDQATSRRFPGLDLHVLNGRRNELQFEPLLDRMATARQRIYVQSPYLAPPFSDELARAAARGVKVSVVTPAVNNWRPWQDHILWKAARAPIELLYYPRMTHMKAMLIDGETLVMGSANYELWSYHFQQEYLAIVTEPALVAEFQRRVVEADLRQCAPCHDTIGSLRGRLADLRLYLLEKAALRVCGDFSRDPS